MTNKFFVPYETAKLLKENGYNEECTFYWGDGIIRIGHQLHTNKELTDNTPNWLYNECISAMTYHEVLDWLEGKGIHIYAEYCNDWVGFIDAGETKETEATGIYPTREQALNAAILKALEML